MPESTPRPGLQQRVTAAILDGAAQLFATGAEPASMNEVAEAAGVARATVYRYFPNREALLEALAQAALRDVDMPPASASHETRSPDAGAGEHRGRVGGRGRRPCRSRARRHGQPLRRAGP